MLLFGLFSLFGEDLKDDEGREIEEEKVSHHWKE